MVVSLRVSLLPDWKNAEQAQLTDPYASTLQWIGLGNTLTVSILTY